MPVRPVRYDIELLDSGQYRVFDNHMGVSKVMDPSDPAFVDVLSQFSKAPPGPPEAAMATRYEIEGVGNGKYRVFDRASGEAKLLHRTDPGLLRLMKDETVLFSMDIGPQILEDFGQGPGAPKPPTGATTAKPMQEAAERALRAYEGALKNGDLQSAQHHLDTYKRLQGPFGAPKPPLGVPEAARKATGRQYPDKFIDRHSPSPRWGEMAMPEPPEAKDWPAGILDRPISGRMSEAALDAEMEAIYGPKSTFPEPGLLESGADAPGQEYDYFKKSSRRSLIDAERQLKHAYDDDSAAALGRAYRHLNEADATGKYLGDATELRALADDLLAQIPPEEWERVEGAYFSGERGRTKDAAEALLDARHARGTVSSTASAAMAGGAAAKQARQRTAALAAGKLFAGKTLRFLGGGALGVAGLALDSSVAETAEVHSPKERALMRDEELLAARLPPESERFVGPGGGERYRAETGRQTEAELAELAARMPPSRMISEGDWK